MKSVKSDLITEIHYCNEKKTSFVFDDQLKKVVIRHEGYPPLEMRTTYKSMIMLRLMLRSKPKQVSRVEIAKATNCNTYKPGVTNENVYEGIKNIRLALVRILKKAGIPSYSVKEMISSVENEGYIFRG